MKTFSEMMVFPVQLISELGLMTEVLNTCMEILTFLVKKRKKKRHKVDFLTFRIVLYVSIQESQ